MRGLATAALRRWWQLPPRRVSSFLEQQWIALSDGVRLATRHWWPVGAERAPVVLVRSDGLASDPTPLIARLWCESGLHVVHQHVRGRGDSEGRFEAFAQEARDGAEALSWLAAQSWCSGPIALAGMGYAGHAAWAALSADSQPIAALAVSGAARDLRSCLHRGDAFCLEAGLRWAVALDPEGGDSGQADIDRGLRHQPVSDADRVAWRRIDEYQHWLAEGAGAPFWRERSPALPETLPPLYSLAGWRDLALEAQLADFAELSARGTRNCELVIGAVGDPGLRSGAVALRDLLQRQAALARFAREGLAFLWRRLGASVSADAPEEQTRPYVRWCETASGRWRHANRFPPSEVDEQKLLLARSPQTGAGVLLDETGVAGPAETRFGGGVTARFEGARLEVDMAIAGRARADLWLDGELERDDVMVRLLDCADTGAEEIVAEGLARVRSRTAPGGIPFELELPLDSAAHCFRRGHRIALELSDDGWPRFARREPPVDAEPGADAGRTRAGLCVRHADGLASGLSLPVLKATRAR